MNKRYARELANTITGEELGQMFDNARNGIENWKKVSSINKTMTKGTAWNILHKCFKAGDNTGTLAKTNMIWEFGDFLPKHLLPRKRTKSKRQPDVCHQEPVF